MGIFSKKQLSVTEQIDLLGQEEKILEARRKNSPNIMTKLIILFLSLTIALLIFFNFKLNIYIGISLGITILTYIYKPYHLKRINKKIEANRKEQKEKGDELKKSVSHAGELYKNLKNDELKSKKVEMNYDSYPFFCHIWDKVFHNYIYNPNALICPICKSNNGLFDMNRTINYICPNCKRHVFSNYKLSSSNEKKKGE